MIHTFQRLTIAMALAAVFGCRGNTPPEQTQKPDPGAPGVVAAQSGIRIVNMIPESLSNETNQDSEPFLAVHQAEMDWMAASAFTRDPAGPTSATAPVFISQDGGKSWTLNSIVPSESMTHDITHAFDSKSLYGGILRASDGHLLQLVTNDFTSADVMTTQASRPDDDQPFVRVVTASGKTFVYVGNNDTAQTSTGGNTATVDVSGDSGTTYKSIRLESRQSADISSCTGRGSNMRQDGPSVRPTAANDGVVYVAYFGWRSFEGSCSDAVVKSDVVVVRDDQRGVGPQPFQALQDPADHKNGIRVQTDVTIPWANQDTLGFERVGSTLALAVDPKNSSRVFIAWADKPSPADVYTVHVRSSADKGVTWSTADLLTRSHSTNAALAVADNGTVALVYQELANGNRWKTHMVQTRDNFTTAQDTVLADTPANAPARQFHPYLGDYLGLVATGNEFRGVFSASNFPDRASFPQGVVYQRRVDFTAHKLTDTQGHDVGVSIDPFFFSVPVKQ